MLTTYINKREFSNTLNLYSNQINVLIDKLIEFVKHKEQYPYNGGISNDMPGFGSSDKRFRSDGNFGTQIRNIAHAHLTDNISVVYLITGDKLNIYGVYTHDVMGTGQPPNINRQKQIATRWSNLDFDTPFSPDDLGPSKKDKEVVVKTKPAGAKPDFTPKAKVAQHATQPAANPVVALAKQVDAHWPQRGLMNKLASAQTKQQAINIISGEAQHIAGLRQRSSKILPNQLDYFKGLQSLYAQYEKQR